MVSMLTNKGESHPDPSCAAAHSARHHLLPHAASQSSSKRAHHQAIESIGKTVAEHLDRVSTAFLSYNVAVLCAREYLHSHPEQTADAKRCALYKTSKYTLING
jgi:hypothetical protein